ncbi:hypothetical protein SUGI_1071890 [Cryptomeria japonica]|uniref:BTB/POZ domain-containing protein At3g50780-like n=1 Tax=Cryptomeria japonica TaxID=3369 RepID=UPI002414899A|nr:BTB/POZ domain-containing protein At3g50780-like [Cryptomeria japonica]GLJ50311.1 hypothetical protein SUGI_1071890 [Cryptomeria japonica]
MDSPFFQFGDQNNSDVKLYIYYSDGHPYGGNPIYLHSQVLKKSGYLEARLKENGISLDITPDGSAHAEDYIDCIRLMYSSYCQRPLSFSNVDDALRILPVASELLFEEGIQACMEYLEAVCWTPQQKLRIRNLLSSLQLNISTDLAERLKISKAFFHEELEVLKSLLLFDILNDRFVMHGVPVQHVQDTLKQQIVAYFEEDIHPAIQKICRDALLDVFTMRIGGFKFESVSTELRDSACESLLWFLDLIKLCKRDVFEAAFTIFVEDEEIADILAKPHISWTPNAAIFGVRSRANQSVKFGQINNDHIFSDSDRSYSSRVLEILVHRFLGAVANGDIVIPKPARVSFLMKWVPIMAYLICTFFRVHNLISESDSPESSLSPTRGLKFSEMFKGGVTKILASLPPSDQKQIFNSFADTAKNFQNWEGGIFDWWTKVIWMAVMAANGSHLQME